MSLYLSCHNNSSGEGIQNYGHQQNSGWSLYLDIRKAFDCVRHSTLLDKLHKIGISENLCCIIKKIADVQNTICALLWM